MSDIPKILGLFVAGAIFLLVAWGLGEAVTAVLGDGEDPWRRGAAAAIACVYLGCALGGLAGVIYLGVKTWNAPVRGNR